jgi:hypothetical protein
MQSASSARRGGPVSEELKSTVAPHADNRISAAIKTKICPRLTIAPIAPVEIYRHLGYPSEVAPAPRMVEHISRVVSEAFPSIHPRGEYALYTVSSRTPHALKLNETTIFGKIGEYLDQAGRVAVFVVTVGKEISHLAESAIKNNDAFSAWVIDAIGSCAVEAAADALMLRVRRDLQDGEELTLRYSPGYCGMHIGQQRKLFQLMRADAVGVTLMPSMLMHPLKSISGLVGLAPKEAVSRYRSPCDLCPRVGCYMQR